MLPASSCAPLDSARARLLALGLELGSSDAGSVVCIDEIEHGLEPHRIRNLVTTLATFVDHVGGHVVFTSHSPVVLSELGSNGVSVVRNTGGKMTVRYVPTELTGVVRSTPEALLVRSVLSVRARPR